MDIGTFNVPLHFTIWYFFEEGPGPLHTGLSLELMLNKCFLNPRSIIKHIEYLKQVICFLFGFLLFHVSGLPLHCITMDRNLMWMCSSQQPFTLAEDLEPPVSLSYFTH